MRQRNRTRKAGRGLTDEEAVFVVPPPPPERVPYNWDKFVIEGDVLYEYMVHNYESMYNGDCIIDFFIMNGIYWLSSEANMLDEKYNISIQSNLVCWIQNEYNEARLLNKENWKPFREHENLTSMYYGYKILYEYNNYIFQLGLINDCNDNGDHCVHFILSLFGWGNETDEYVKRYMINELPIDKIMPEQYWNRK
jgi:hypothetical protein